MTKMCTLNELHKQGFVNIIIPTLIFCKLITQIGFSWEMSCNLPLTLELILQLCCRSEYSTVGFTNKSQKSAASSLSQTYRRGVGLLNVSKR